MSSVKAYSQAIPVTLSDRLLRAVVGGIIGTIPMSALMYYGPKLGLPRWPVPDVLAAMFNVSICAGWIIHFAVGVLLALLYLFTLNNWLPVRTDILRGAIYGVPAYGIAFLTWMILMRAGIVELNSLYVISYPYLIHHIVFAAVMGIYIPQSKRIHQFA